MNIRRQEGFTLIELMIVVAIVAILASVSIPILTNARMRTNEGSAVSSIRTLTSANTTYRTRFGSFANGLNDLNGAGIIDSVLAGAVELPGKSGYLFQYTLTGPGSWELEARPVEPGASGQRYFFCDTSGIIRSAEGGPADSSSVPLD